MRGTVGVGAEEKAEEEGREEEEGKAEKEAEEKEEKEKSLSPCGGDSVEEAGRPVLR